MSKDKPNSIERRCRPLLSDEDILFIYNNATALRRGRPPRGTTSKYSLSAMADRFNIEWLDVQAIVRGCAFREVTGATKTTATAAEVRSMTINYEELARETLSVEQIRAIRRLARLGPADPRKAPLTYASLGIRFKLPAKVIRAIKLKKILADVPDTDPQDQQPTPADAGNHWM